MLDGAKRIKTDWFITIPMIKGTLKKQCLFLQQRLVSFFL